MIKKVYFYFTFNKYIILLKNEVNTILKEKPTFYPEFIQNYHKGTTIENSFTQRIFHFIYVSDTPLTQDNTLLNKRANCKLKIKRFDLINRI